MIKAVLQATQAVVKPENRDDAVNHAATLFKIDRSTAAEFHRRLVLALSPTGIVETDKIRLAIESAVERGLIQKPLEPEAVVDFSFARELRF